jgi:hypothetical protein
VVLKHLGVALTQLFAAHVSTDLAYVIFIYMLFGWALSDMQKALSKSILTIGDLFLW